MSMLAGTRSRAFSWWAFGPVFGPVLGLILVLLLALAAAGVRAQSVQPQWSLDFGPDMNVARMGHWSATLPDGRVALFGGHGVGFTALDSAEFLAADAAALSLQSMLYTHDYSAFAQLADGRYLLAGGAADRGVAPGHAGAELFNPATVSFTATGKLNYPRMNASAATLASGQVLVVGGWYDNASALMPEVYDPASDAFYRAGPLNTPRALPVVLPASDDSALVLGGVDPFGTHTIEQVELYNPITNTFSVVRSSLFAGETGWRISASNYTLPQRLPDGRYLLLAQRPAADATEYSLFTMDPVSRALTRHSTVPALPDSSWATLQQPLVDPATGLAYLIGTLVQGSETVVGLLVVDPSDWSLYWPEFRYRLSPDIYLGYAAGNLLPDGRLFLSGGHSETGGQTNFSALAWTLLAEIEAGTGSGGTTPEDPPDGECSYTLSALKLSAGAAASNGTLALTTSGADCSWSASSEQSWLQLSGASSGTGSASLSYTVAANTTGQPRMGVLEVAGQKVVLLQAAEQAEARTDGTAGNDLLSLPAWEEGDAVPHIDGHGGVDTLQLPAFPSRFTLSETAPGQYTLSDGQSTYTLSNIEQLRFGSSTPTTLPLASLLSGEAQQQLARLTDLYLAFFGRAPDVSGLEYWQSQLLEHGRGLDAIAKDFAWSAEAQALYPATGSNRDFVRTVYLNVFDREPDAGGWDYWTGRLDGLGSTDLSERGAFVGALLLGAYAPSSGEEDRTLLSHRHDVALSYVNRLATHSHKSFDGAINDLLAQVDGSQASVAGAESVLDYVFDTTRNLDDIITEPELLDRLWQPVTPLDWQADARWLNAIVTLPDPSPLLMSEVEVSVLFEDYQPDAQGRVSIPAPDAPFTDVTVLLPVPGTEDYAVYLFATVLEGETELALNLEMTALNLVLNGIDREQLTGGLPADQVKAIIRDNSTAFINRTVAAMLADPFYLRPDNLANVYDATFNAAVSASREALEQVQPAGNVVFSTSVRAYADSPTDSEGLTVLPNKEIHDFKVFPARWGTLGYGDMKGELLIQNDSMLPARYLALEYLSGDAMNVPPAGIFGQVMSPQSSVIYGYNASSTTTSGFKFQSTRLAIFTPGWLPYNTEDSYLKSLADSQATVLSARLLADNLITILSNLIPVSDESFYQAWFQWVGDQGWFQAAADKLYTERDLPGAIQAFADGLRNWDNMKSTLKFAAKYFAKSVGGEQEAAKQILKAKAKWLFKVTTWKAKVYIYAADLTSTGADLAQTPGLITFEQVSFPLFLMDYGPRSMDKVGTLDAVRRVTLSGDGLGAFGAGGATHEPNITLRALDLDGVERTEIIQGKDIHSDGAGNVWFDLPYEWVSTAGEIVGPIYFQLNHAFVDPYTNSVIEYVNVPRSLNNPAYQIVLGTELVITHTSTSKVTGGAELQVFGSGFAPLSSNNVLLITDHTGRTEEARIEYAAANYLEVIVPESLAAGPLTLQATLPGNIESNLYQIALVPRWVGATPPDRTDFDTTLQVQLTQQNGVPIRYRINDGPEHDYSAAFTLEDTATVYAYARETVDGVNYDSATLSFFYYRCAENEELVSGECKAPEVPFTEKVIDMTIEARSADAPPRIVSFLPRLPLKIFENGQITFDYQYQSTAPHDLLANVRIWGSGSWDGERLILEGNWTRRQTGGWTQQYGQIITRDEDGRFSIDTRGGWDEPLADTHASTHLVTEYGTWTSDQQRPYVRVNNLLQLEE